MHIPAKLNDEPVKEGTKIQINEYEYIQYITKFKYLGSKITASLADELDIKSRIAAASSQVYKMRHLFGSNQVSLQVKKMMYLAIPLNTVLWGCETCSIKKSDLKKLEAFHHSSIRKILKISMNDVKEKRITNQAIREKFHNIHTIKDFITRRSLNYLGKTVRTDGDNKLHKCFLTAYCHSPRHAGGQQKTHRDCFVDHIKKIIPETSKDAPLKEWADIALNKVSWRGSINNWWKEKQDADLKTKNGLVNHPL